MDFHTIIKTIFEIALVGAFVLSVGYFILTACALALSRLRNKPETITDESLCPTVTVQIPTYNELAALNCAARCLDFDYPAEKLQIMIGDDSNQPEISAKIDAFVADNPRVEISRRGDNIGFKPGFSQAARGSGNQGSDTGRGTGRMANHQCPRQPQHADGHGYCEHYPYRHSSFP
jgi:cellulose synthase/poly-beta-1,6-N-acetylglucosamine synthase-like glycosyltransferase